MLHIEGENKMQHHLSTKYMDYSVQLGALWFLFWIDIRSFQNPNKLDIRQKIK